MNVGKDRPVVGVGWAFPAIHIPHVYLAISGPTVGFNSTNIWLHCYNVFMFCRNEKQLRDRKGVRGNEAGGGGI